MPISFELARAAANTGLSIVCAACEHYWAAHEHGHPDCGKSNCGSPLVSDTFSSYKGVMTDDAFQRFCFVCGAESESLVEVVPKVRRVGVCAQHEPWVRKQQFMSHTPVCLHPKPQLPPRGTLLGEIVNTEKEWAEARGETFSYEEFLKRGT